MISSVDRRSEYVENRAGANVRLNNFLTPYTLDDKSSILNAPCGYSNGVYASLRPVENLGPELVAETPSNLNGWIDARSNTILSVVNNNIRATRLSEYAATIGISSTGFATVIGKTYEVKIIATKNNTSGSIYARISNNSQITAPVFNEQNTTDTISVDSTFVATATTSFIGVLATAQGDGDYIQSSLMSVRELLQPSADFDFTRGSAATRVTKDGLIKNVQILSGELVTNGDFEQIGSELVTNGDFATDSDWTKGSSWTIANGQASYDASGVSPITSATTSIVSGKTYRLKFKITTSGFARLNFTNDSSQVLFQPNESSVNNFSSGEHTFYLLAQNNSTALKIFAYNGSGGTSFSIDNVSVKEVGQNWVVTDGWSIENGKANIDTSEGTGSFNQLGVLTIGKKYRLSLSAAMTVGRVKFQSDAAGVFIFSTDVSNHEFIASSTDVSFRRFDTTTSGYIDNVSIIEITDDTDLPRIDYTDGTGSLLLEPQSTNLVTYSEDFSQWTSGGGTITTQSGFLAPDGSNNAIKITSSDISAASSYFALTGLNLTETNTRTIYAKTVSGTGTVKLLSHNSNTNNTFTLTENYQRFEVNTTASATGLTFFYGVDFRGGTTLSEVIIWGAQAEDLSYATSYIPTNGSTVTRDADVCNNSGSSDLINSTEGVLYAEIAALANDGTSRRISLSSGSDANRVSLEIDETSNRIKVFMNGGSISAAIITFDASDLTQFNKIAIKYKSGDVSLFLNGTEVATSTSTNMPVGLDRLNFDGGNGNNDFYGKVKCVAVFKEALTDEELAKITSVTQQEAFYEMRDKMLQINADYYEFGDYTTRLKKLF